MNAATVLYWYEDFPVGRRIDLPTVTVERDAVLAFARDFDPQPFHVDDAAAAASPFGRLAASGWHTCAMAMRLACDSYLLQTASLGSPGVEDLKWPAPVYPGDVLGGHVTVLQARVMNSKPHIGLVRLRTALHNQHGTLVMSMEGWAMVRLRLRPAPAA